jgi:hypothetical protein
VSRKTLPHWLAQPHWRANASAKASSNGTAKPKADEKDQAQVKSPSKHETNGAGAATANATPTAEVESVVQGALLAPDAAYTPEEKRSAFHDAIATADVGVDAGDVAGERRVYSIRPLTRLSILIHNFFAVVVDATTSASASVSAVVSGTGTGDKRAHSARTPDVDPSAEGDPKRPKLDEGASTST